MKLTDVSKVGSSSEQLLIPSWFLILLKVTERRKHQASTWHFRLFILKAFQKFLLHNSLTAYFESQMSGFDVILVTISKLVQCTQTTLTCISIRNNLESSSLSMKIPHKFDDF